MSNKSIFARTIMVMLPMSFMLLSAFAAGGASGELAGIPVLAAAVQAQARCRTNKATDEAIVKAIQDKIKADSRWNEESRTRINIMSRKRVVKIEGSVNNQSLKDEITKFAVATDCVIKKSVKNLLRTSKQGSCSPGQKPCCGACIDRSSDCNFMN